MPCRLASGVLVNRSPEAEGVRLNLSLAHDCLRPGWIQKLVDQQDACIQVWWLTCHSARPRRKHYSVEADTSRTFGIRVCLDASEDSSHFPTVLSNPPLGFPKIGQYYLVSSHNKLTYTPTACFRSSLSDRVSRKYE